MQNQMNPINNALNNDQKKTLLFEFLIFLGFFGFLQIFMKKS